MSSHAKVRSAMLALEEAFDVEFPESTLKRSVFESVAAIADAIGALEVQAACSVQERLAIRVGRHLRDVLSARLMVANERIRTIDAGLLLIAKEV